MSIAIFFLWLWLKETMDEPKKRKMEIENEKNNGDSNIKCPQVLVKDGGVIAKIETKQHRIDYKAVLRQKGYLVGETLGSGSYSKVKRATYIAKRSDHRNVAIKIVDRLKAPQDYQQRFLPREIEVWRKLNHPFLLKLEDCFTDSDHVYMITEFASNGDTLRWVQEQGALPEHNARVWVKQIGEAIRYMHVLNIAHRDLKLENILIDKNLAVKIADFGFVKGDCMSSLSETFCGSKSYAAPEILKGKAYDPMKSDIWAMGVIIYILVTGKMPFDEARGTKHILMEQQNLHLYWPRNKPVSLECQKLIKDMFTWEFKARPAISKVMQSFWIVNKKFPREPCDIHHLRLSKSS